MRRALIAFAVLTLVATINPAGAQCVAGGLPDGRVADFFTIGNDQITRLAVYTGPPPA